MSLLEVGAGSSNVPQYAAERLRPLDIELDITVLDRVASHLNGSRPAIVGDALALPVREGSFDLVSCSLFAHHLMPEALKQFVTAALRVSRVAVLINDLVRSPVHLALVYAGLPLFRSRITWHDAPASVRQAYTVSEMCNLLEQTPAARVDVSRHFLFHMGVIAWKI
jgi:SAM-dependent methyltransferase